MNYIDSSGHNYGNPDTVQWQKKPFADVPLTDEQMDIFNRSYSPDWECRYYPIKFADYHYLIRSGFWVCKFFYILKVMTGCITYRNSIPTLIRMKVYKNV